MIPTQDGTEPPAVNVLEVCLRAEEVGANIDTVRVPSFNTECHNLLLSRICNSCLSFSIVISCYGYRTSSTGLPNLRPFPTSTKR